MSGVSRVSLGGRVSASADPRSGVGRLAHFVVLLLIFTGSALGLLAVAAERAAADPGGWGQRRSLTDARASPTSTRLFGGKVLVAGGEGAGAKLSSAELFSPENDSWTPTGSLTTARSSHTATLISNRPPACSPNCRKVLVAGGTGSNGAPLASAELFDPVTSNWTSTGALTDARTSHTATLLPNGRILVVGGSGLNNNQPLGTAEIFNPASGSWTATAPLATARSSHTATLLQNGKVLVAGGVGPSGQPLTSSEVYDPSANSGAGSWTPTGALANARSAHSATPLGDEISGSSDRRVLVAGGTGPGGTRLASAEVYNPQDGTWTQTGSLANERAFHTAALLPDGKVVVPGGSGTGGRLASAELFSPATGTWTPTGSLATPRSAHGATVLLDGRVLVAGGAGPAGQPLPSAELYEPSLGERWAPTASMASARSAHTATVLPNGEVLVAGGQTSFDSFLSFGPGCCNVSPLATAELYRPSSGTWSQTGVLVRARSFHTATLLRGSPEQCGTNCGKVLVAGGFGAVDPPGPSGNAESLASVELYDPATGQWAATGPLSGRRAWHTATLLADGKVLVAGGTKSPVAGDAIDTAELYDPVSGTWTPTGSLLVGGNPNRSGAQGARAVHAAALLTGSPAQCGNNCGKVLVVGGTGGFGSGASFSSAELYDPATGAFRRTTALGQIRQLQPNENATRLLDGRVLVAGGFHSPFTDVPPHLDTAEVYDPLTETWTPTGLLGNRRLYQSQTLLPSGQVLATGGLAGGNAPSFPFKPGPGLLSSEAYDPANNGWRATSFMNAGRLLHTATLLPSGPPSVCGDNCGKVLVAGGDRELIGNFIPFARYSNPLSSAELYGPSPSAGGAPSASVGGAPITSGARPSPAAVVAVARRVSISPSAFFAANSGPSVRVSRQRRTGARVSYRLNLPASVRFTAERASKGRRVGRLCVAKRKSNRKRRGCVRYIALRGNFTLQGRVGSNGFRFSGRIGGRKLQRGGYRLVATPTAGGRVGTVGRKGFRIRG